MITGTIANTAGVTASNNPAKAANTNAKGETVLSFDRASWTCSTHGISVDSQT